MPLSYEYKDTDFNSISDHDIEKINIIKKKIRLDEQFKHGLFSGLALNKRFF